MVAIDNKSNSTSNLVGIKSGITVDEVDVLFAELFALVNSENNNEQTGNDHNIVNILQSNEDSKNPSLSINDNIDKKTEDLARSLVQIFYKDIGINQATEVKNQNLNTQSKNIKTQKNSVFEKIIKGNQIDDQNKKTESKY